MANLWRTFEGLTPHQTGEDTWTLADCFRRLDFRRCGAHLRCGDAPPLRTGAALVDCLMPPVGLNAQGQTSGRVLTPLGVMQFDLGSVKERWSREWRYRLSLTTPATNDGTARPHGFLQIVTYDNPPGMTGSPYAAMQDGKSGIDPSPGLRRAMAAVQRAAWLALATPQTLHAVRMQDLEADLNAALEAASHLSAHADRWEAATRVEAA